MQIYKSAKSKHFGTNGTPYYVPSVIDGEPSLYIITTHTLNILTMPAGLKPAQRKVMFMCFKRNDKSKVMVAQLAGSVTKHTIHHHEEVSDWSKFTYSCILLLKAFELHQHLACTKVIIRVAQ